MRQFRPIALLFSLTVLVGLFFCASVRARCQALPGPNAQGLYDPADYGAVPHTDASAQIQAAADAASAVGGTIQVHAPYYTSRGITSTNCNIVFTGRNVILQYWPKAGVTDPIWTIYGSTGRCMTITGAVLNGPGGTTLGVASTTVDGFKIMGGPVCFRDCSVGRVFCAYDIENPGGHDYFDNCDTGAVWYGLWYGVNDGDIKMTDSRFAALFANVGYGALGMTLDARRSHLGYSPFAFYQVATNPTVAAGQDLMVLDDCAMEAIGNEAIYSEYARLKPIANNIVNTTDLTIVHSGISFLPLYQLPGYPHDYAIEMDAPEGEINLDFGILGVPSGALGTIYERRPTANGNLQTFKWRHCPANPISTLPGQKAPAMTVVGAM